ncbi:DUF2075 domain-containing protein [Stenotrophomonas sp. MMGLT7]|uniref:DUF2075 domain-containing protein n=1 Tax=Stenotrophomonas sp. MMGLT7 TaxID=2901227 RepID=UPI001E29B417|nr:DUF2075 domain-containing protein [Stenotrophomonas sp. MMGLT7]MCD7100145.1 DUF2075 domain-containing protein [Stenotrophomonas sp. MMGLT7]
MSATNQASFKLSPEKTLSAEQRALERAVQGFIRAHADDRHALLVIQGDAGTGKSVLLNSIFRDLQAAARTQPHGPLYGSANYLLVNHAEMIKAYRNAADGQPSLRKKDYERPTSFINRMHGSGRTADIVLVDEAHLLLTRSDRYNRFVQDNQLEEIVRLARIVVLVFDAGQVLKFKSLWNPGDLDALIARWPHEVHVLRRQFRMRADAAVRRWIEAFGRGRLLPLPRAAAGGDAFELKVFDDAQAMYDAVRDRNARCGLSRMLSTYDYPYKLDGRDHFIEEGRFRLRWDRSKPDERLPWAEREDTIDEVGSVYTIQGFDLNYVGLILGPSLAWDEQRGEIVLDPSRYEDGAAFQGKAQLADPEAVKRRIMLNAINVLMTRAIHGLYLYAHDPALRRRLLALQAGRAMASEKPGPR